MAEPNSLLGGDLTVTIRYGWAIVQNLDNDSAAVCAPSVNRWSLHFDLVSWHDSYDDAFDAVLILHHSGITVNSWKEQKDGRKRKKKGTSPEQGGGGEAAAPRQIAAGPEPEGSLAERLAAALSRASGRRFSAGDIVDAEVVTDG